MRPTYPSPVTKLHQPENLLRLTQTHPPADGRHLCKHVLCSPSYGSCCWSQGPASCALGPAARHQTAPPRDARESPPGWSLGPLCGALPASPRDAVHAPCSRTRAWPSLFKNRCSISFHPGCQLHLRQRRVRRPILCRTLQHRPKARSCLYPSGLARCPARIKSLQKRSSTLRAARASSSGTDREVLSSLRNHWGGCVCVISRLL